MVPGGVLNSFVTEHADMILAAIKLKPKLKSSDCPKTAEEVVWHVNIFHNTYGYESLGNNQVSQRKTGTLWNCSLVQKIAALSGLIPFWGVFIDYIECSIPVTDTTRNSMVIYIGTTLHKFSLYDKHVYLPCLS